MKSRNRERVDTLVAGSTLLLMRLRPSALFGLAVAAVSVVSHLPSLRNGLVWDDAGTIPESGSLLSAVGRSFWSKGQGRNQYYRPLTTLSLAIDRSIGGSRAEWFHLTNLILHGGVVFLFYRLLLLISGATRAAALAALIFGTHRLTADSVAYVSGRTDMLAGLGFLIGLTALLQYSGGQAGAGVPVELLRPRRRDLLLVLLGCAVALGAKESGMVLPVVVAGWLAGTRQLKKSWLLLAGVLALSALYLFWRSRVLGCLLDVSPVPAGSLLLLALNSSGYLLVEALLHFNSRLFLWRPGELASLSGWAVPALLLLLLPVGLWRRSAPGLKLRMLLMWGASVLTLFPFAGVAQFGPVGRFFYLPGFGLIALALLAGLNLPARWRVRQILLVAALAGSTLMVPALWERIGWWRNDVVLFSRLTRDAPGYAPAFYNLGNAQVRAGDTLSAIAAYQQAVKLDSGLISASLNLGALLLAGGEIRQAALVYRSLLRHRPEYAAAYVNLGIVLHRLGDQPAAIETLRQAARLDPGSASAAYNLSRLFWLNGEIDSARAWAERAKMAGRQSPK